MKPGDTKRQQIEIVFGLTGGELADEPWKTDENPDGYPYWYEGIPEWAHDDFPAEAGWKGSIEADRYRTLVLADCLFDPEKELTLEGLVWKLIQTYTSSGEAECPDRAGLVVDSPVCPLCEADQGEEHGYIYLGSCLEVVYRLEESESI